MLYVAICLHYFKFLIIIVETHINFKKYCKLIIFFFLQAYQKDLSKKEWAYLDSTLGVLRMTSILMNNFTSPLPFRSADNARLIQNKEVLKWIESRESEIKTLTGLTASEKKQIDFFWQAFVRFKVDDYWFWKKIAEFHLS